MEKLPNINLTEVEKQVLIEEAWVDKKGRISSLGTKALYIALDSPKPNLATLTNLVLEEISGSNSAAAKDWASRWDKVIISVKGDGKLSCLLGDIDDDRNRAYICVNTKALVSPEEMVKALPGGNLATILINSKPRTIEALLISYIHMVNELIWDLYRGKLQKANLSASTTLYQETVLQVKEKGFLVKPANEEEILLAKKNYPNVSIRLYGSGVEKDVPKVMGAILFKPMQSVDGDNYLEKLKDEAINCEKVEMVRREKEHISAKSIKPVLVTSVTLGKELHAGHMFLLATADLLRTNLGSNDTVVLINNNTGPRAAGALVALSEKLGLGLGQTALLLDIGSIAPETIMGAYKTRLGKGVAVENALRLLDSGKYDIFAGMSSYLMPKLDETGFRVCIVPESDGLGQTSNILEMINPRWGKSGFVFMQSGKGVRVLQKEGLLTATGKCVVSMTRIAEPYLVPSQIPLMIFVDSSPDATDAVSILSSLQEFYKAAQAAGAGVSFGGKIASGSNGEALTITQLLEEYKNLSPERPLSEALRYLVLTRPLTIPNVKTPNLALSYYDYKDNDSLVRDLINCQKESYKFGMEVKRQLSFLEVKVGDTTTTIDPKSQKTCLYLSQQMQSLLKTSPEEIIQSISRTKSVGISGEFNKLEYGLARFIPKLKARYLLLEALVQDITKASAITEYVRGKGNSLPDTLFGNDFDVSCDILDAVIKQGYVNQDAVAKTYEYIEGPKGLVIRENYYLKNLSGFLGLQKQVISITDADFDMMRRIIIYCVERLGYETN